MGLCYDLRKFWGFGRYFRWIFWMEIVRVEEEVLLICFVLFGRFSGLGLFYLGLMGYFGWLG
jgi:hypothetical protein